MSCISQIMTSSHTEQVKIKRFKNKAEAGPRVGPVLVGLQLTSTAAPSAVRVGELVCGHPRYPNPTRTPGPVLTMLCGAPLAPGSTALPIARAAPWQSHLMERGGVQDPAEREVGQPLECPGKGSEMSAPTCRPPRKFGCVCGGCLS